MADITDYTGLITSEHKDKPKFVATVALSVSPFVQFINVLKSLDTAYDVDYAVGVQLDIIGSIVGISRQVNVNLPNVYFTWDSTATVGWDSGIWQGTSTDSITSLPDDIYRTFIYAKIAANAWDGTINGAYAVYDIVFPSLSIIIQDNHDMTYNIVLSGMFIDALTLALITGGYLPLKPEGVAVNTYYIANNSGPVFGWDTESPGAGGIQGWDTGSWATAYTP